MRYRAIILSTILMSACGPSNNESGENNTTANNGQNDGPTWEMAETEYTPTVTGTSVEYMDDQTIVLSGSSPAGWTVTFTSQSGFADNSFYASDNETDPIGGTLEGPDDTCSVPAGADNPDLVTLQTATFDGDTPVGAGSIAAANCYGSPDQGAIWSVAFGVN